MIELILPAVSLLGMALVSRHEYRFWGFLISGIGNILWLIRILFYEYDDIELYLFSGYLIFNAIGMHDEFATWHKIRSIKFNKH